MSLDDDLASSEFQHGVSQGFWELVKRDGDLVYINMHAPDERSYVLKLACERYGSQALDGKFVDPKNLTCVASAWPKGNATFAQWVKFTEGNLFICWDQDRTGISHHQNWHGSNRWGDNQLISYLDFIRILLYVPWYGYERRET